MKQSTQIYSLLVAVPAIIFGWVGIAQACCVTSVSKVPAVNADQTVIIIWDKENKQQHLIRKASFQTAGADVGFLVPTPTRPELAAAGNEAFTSLATITAQEYHHKTVSGCSCSVDESITKASVRIIDQKIVAGYQTVVLAADSGASLTEWLKENGYAYSPEVAAWAQPYLDQKWLITAMKLAPKEKTGKFTADALRISFQTDRPLFPYRESDTRESAKSLGVNDRMLRIYFLAEARYVGQLSDGSRWNGKPVWSGAITDESRTQIITTLKLPETTGPKTYWLTEFEDHWKYGIAAGDVYFSVSSDQSNLTRPEQISRRTIDASALAIAIFAICVPIRRRLRNSR